MSKKKTPAPPEAAKPAPKPHTQVAGLAVGRIVHFVLPDDDDCLAPYEHRAAIITMGTGPDTANLTVFLNGEEDYPPEKHPGNTWHLKGIQYDEGGAELTWHWPERDTPARGPDDPTPAPVE